MITKDWIKNEIDQLVNMQDATIETLRSIRFELSNIEAMIDIIGGTIKQWESKLKEIDK
ncbi:MAG: hypothetical protein FWF38_00435 [Spirochaetaceae bacterium]|nr:hypothetical protein [Spirochaetaceae bacterium]